MTRRFLSPVAALLLLLSAGAGWTFYAAADPGAGMTEAAQKYIASLNEEQKAKSLLAYEAPERLDWHFIPKDYRKGLQIKEMTQPQRQAALALLRESLSQVGYDKATRIMELEGVLRELESKGGGGRNIRDPERYYFTLFGEPAEKGKWGLSIEGHHLSLNFVVEGGKVVSSTPTFFASNPAVVKTETNTGVKVGTRVLANEEQLAFDLLHALSDEQRAVAVVADKAPSEIRAAGEPQPPSDAAVGIAYGKLTEDQRRIMQSLVKSYAENVPAEIAAQRINDIKQAGPENVHFAWAGAQQPGIGHYYRIQGPTFLIEFVNTQPDAAGNPANHIHCVWRDMRGDFAIAVGAE